MFIIQDFIKKLFLSLFLYLFLAILNKTSLYIGIVTYGPALALETVTGLDRWVSVWVRVFNHLENYYISIFVFLEYKIFYVNLTFTPFGSLEPFVSFIHLLEVLKDIFEN